MELVKVFFACLVLLCIKCNIEKRIRKQNQEVNDLKIIDTKKEMKNQNYWTLNNQSVITQYLLVNAQPLIHLQNFCVL